MIFYLRGGSVVGILLWNITGKIYRARQVRKNYSNYQKRIGMCNAHVHVQSKLVPVILGNIGFKYRIHATVCKIKNRWISRVFFDTCPIDISFCNHISFPKMIRSAWWNIPVKVLLYGLWDDLFLGMFLYSVHVYYSNECLKERFHGLC